MSGSVSTGTLVIAQDSTYINDYTDVIITSATHTNSIQYDSTNWINKALSIEDITNLSISANTHNEVLIWNSTTSLWENGKISDLLTELEGVVTGVISVILSVFIGEAGDPAKSLCVAFTDDLESGFTVSIVSCGDNNAVYKKSPTDSIFTYLTTLNMGEIYNNTQVAGTIFRSDKGLSGFSLPFPMPLGVSCLADTYFRFYALRESVTVHVTSVGRDSSVTLYASDETTIVDGPTLINAYGSADLLCDSNAEFVVIATTPVFCGTKGDRGDTVTNNRFIDMRIIPPMSTEIIVHNRNNRISSQELDTDVTYYRRNMDTGSVTVQAGTPLSTTGVAGNDTDYANDGWLILRADKPICGFSGADGNGFESSCGVPIDKLSQVFPILSTMGTSTDYGRASVSLAGPYEGSATVYDESGTVLGTFTLTRGTTPATTADQQLFPASGQWNPQTEIGTSVTSGYVEANVPCICIQNLDGSSIFTSDAGDELNVFGSSPEEIKAVIRRDDTGMLRRRDLATDGSEVWTIC